MNPASNQLPATGSVSTADTGADSRNAVMAEVLTVIRGLLEHRFAGEGVFVGDTAKRAACQLADASHNLDNDSDFVIAMSAKAILGASTAWPSLAGLLPVTMHWASSVARTISSPGNE